MYQRMDNIEKAITERLTSTPSTHRHDSNTPIALIDQFLNKHGTATKGVITTTPGNLLHKSNTFQTLCINKGNVNDTANIIPNLDLKGAGTEQRHHTVRTDNGGELAGSADFRQVIGNHGYILETTAPDASNQN
jgi:hypothetical protein